MKVASMKEKKAKVRVFGLEGDHPCVWMKAGVINFKLCDNAYDCLTCAFDKAMSERVEAGDPHFRAWRSAYQEKTYNQKQCRHALTGRVPMRLCGNSYQCAECEFDQMLESRSMTELLGRPALLDVSGFRLADGYYYHPRHTWARVEHGGLVRFGVDDFTMHLLGYVTHVRLPKLGVPVKGNKPAWTFRREEKIAPLVAPMDGVVVAVNHKASDNPQLIKEDPYGEGWLVVVEPRHLKRDLTELYADQAARTWLTAEAHRLEALVAPDSELPLAATGGEVVEDIYGSVPHLTWDRLVAEFLAP